MRLTLITAAACLALFTAACGGEGTDAPTAAEQDNARDTARTKLMQCLREQGIEQPRQSATGPDQAKLQEAIDGPCKDAASDAFGGTDPRKDPEFQDALTRFRACLADEGVDSGQIDRSDPKVQQAMTACRDELPENLRGGGR